MKALITGAAGFVGFELVQQLREAGHEPLAAIGPVQHPIERWRLNRLVQMGIQPLEFDLRRIQPFAEAPRGWDVLVHLAAYVQTEKASDDVEINDRGTYRLLAQLGSELRGKRVLFTSSIAAIDSCFPRFGKLTLATPCRPRTRYGASKLAGEAVVREMADRLGFDYTILRFPTLYGPGFRPGGMFDALARQLPKQKLAVRIDWPGKMSLLEVRDASRMVIGAASHKGAANRTFLLSSGEDPSMGQIAEHVAQCLGTPYRRIRLPPLTAAVLRKVTGPFWQAKFLPHAVQIAAWRASLILNGLYCDGSELTRLLGISYQPWREAFARMYAEAPNSAHL